MIIGSLSIDLSHALCARSQLQNAADSAALTGAYYLTTVAPTRVNTQKSEEFARIMASRCTVDGPTKATIKFVPGNLIKSHPGVWSPPPLTSSQDLQFAKNMGNWRVALIH